MTCSNCLTTLSCTCAKRTASDGRNCCTNCINAYEASIKSVKTSQTVVTVWPIPTELKN